MAKAKAQRNNNGFGDIKFAAIKLETEGKDEFANWYKSTDNAKPEDIGELLVMGWKCSVTWDGNNDCFIASYTQRDEDDRNYNVCVTSRSDDITEALFLGVFKIAVMFADKKIPTEQVKDNWG
jgi:hypothetical protein